MLAGTLCLIDETLKDPLESWYRGDGVTGLDVSDTQNTLNGRPIQSGVAAGTVTRQKKVPTTAVNRSGDTTSIVTEQVDQGEKLLTEWVADVTGTGLVVIESIDGDGQLDFPLDMFYARMGEHPQRQYVDVEALHIEWSDEDVLGDVWLNAAEAPDGSSINYHQQAEEERPASTGLGFERPWNGTVMRGVVYKSGYLAVYNSSKPTNFVQFIEEEILRFCHESEDEDDEDGQATLQESAGDDSGNTEEWTEGTCEQCGHVRTKTKVIDGDRTCIICDEERDA